MNKLSVIIPVLNDFEEINLTIKSIRETSPAAIEVIVVDDHSDVPVILQDSSSILIRNQQRVGAGCSRHIGALKSTGKYMLLTDSHMRFTSGWYEKALNHLQTSENTLWCSCCGGLDAENMDPLKPKGIYTGADLVYYRKSDNKVFEGVWRGREEGDSYIIPCIMGATYFMAKDWFFYLKGLEYNKLWGDEEPFLSTKSWLAGGDVKLMNDFNIGHKFRGTSPYSTEVSAIKYNKIRPIKVLFPKDMADKLIAKIPEDGDKLACLRMCEQDKSSIEEEAAYYQSIFKHDVQWLIDKFKIPCEI